MFEMLSKDINSYSNEVRKYVDGILLAALTAEVDLDKARQQQNLLVLNKILGNSLLRYEIVDRIVDYGMNYCMSSYKSNLSDDVRRTVFMRKVYSFLDMHQISLLAVQFDKQIEAAKAEKHSR